MFGYRIIKEERLKELIEHESKFFKFNGYHWWLSELDFMEPFWDFVLRDNGWSMSESRREILRRLDEYMEREK